MLPGPNAQTTTGEQGPSPISSEQLQLEASCRLTKSYWLKAREPCSSQPTPNAQVVASLDSRLSLVEVSFFASSHFQRMATGLPLGDSPDIDINLLLRYAGIA